jgi:glycosyltransferase involved in cell wall biosynthesis
MKISVITCFFNVDKYLEESIESVLSQHYEDWELLLIDDGSTDNSTFLAKKYAKKYPSKIFYFEHENHINKGLSASRNLGISKFTGHFVTFLDGDDVWKPNYLFNQLKVIEENKVPVVCEATEYWYNWDNTQKENVKVYVGAEQNKQYEPPQLLLKLYPIGQGASPCMCSIILHRNVLERHKFEDSFRGMYEDQVLLSKLFLNESIYLSPACNNSYRQRLDSLVGSSHKKGDYFKIRKHFLEWLKLYLQKEKFEDSEVNFLIRKSLLKNRHAFLQFHIQKMKRKLKSILKKLIIK